MERPVPSQAEGGRSPPAGLPSLPAPLSAVLPPPPAGALRGPSRLLPFPLLFPGGTGPTRAPRRAAGRNSQSGLGPQVARGVGSGDGSDTAARGRPGGWTEDGGSVGPDPAWGCESRGGSPFLACRLSAGGVRRGGSLEWSRGAPLAAPELSFPSSFSKPGEAASRPPAPASSGRSGLPSPGSRKRSTPGP